MIIRMPSGRICRCTSVSWDMKTISDPTGWWTMRSSSGGATWLVAGPENLRSPLHSSPSIKRRWLNLLSKSVASDEEKYSGQWEIVYIIIIVCVLYNSFGSISFSFVCWKIVIYFIPSMTCLHLLSLIGFLHVAFTLFTIFDLYRVFNVFWILFKQGSSIKESEYDAQSDTFRRSSQCKSSGNLINSSRNYQVN